MGDKRLYIITGIGHTNAVTGSGEHAQIVETVAEGSSFRHCETEQFAAPGQGTAFVSTDGIKFQKVGL